MLLGSSGYLPLVVFYPAMLWVVGGRWWGLLGMVFHLALLLKGVLQDVSQLNGFLVSWTLFAWACSLRCVPLGCWPFPGRVLLERPGCMSILQRGNGANAAVLLISPLQDQFFAAEFLMMLAAASFNRHADRAGML